MNRPKHATVATLWLLAIVLAPTALADDFAVDWWTVDSGGCIFSTGGDFELGGTIGQPDANAVVMTGGPFELTGGFWVAPPCWCLSDLNNDGRRDGRDVQGFVDCLLAGGANCACADLHTDGHLDLQDVPVFVNGLLAGGECP